MVTLEDIKIERAPDPLTFDYKISLGVKMGDIVGIEPPYSVGSNDGLGPSQPERCNADR